jgi:tRNA pseudouridine13 synthase
VHVTEPYLTADLPGIGGVIKEQPQDFVVEELPLYPPSGEGEHTLFEIKKTGVSTFQAVRSLAQALGVSTKRIGYAGLKDAQAVSCQTMSVHGVPAQDVMALELANIEIMWAELHRNKLKIGHLRGNRFTIRVRGVDASAVPSSQTILDVLVQRGVPNRYGPQRFGLRGNSALLGRAVVDADPQAFVETLLGGPDERESDVVREARSRFDAGQWGDALHLLPHSMANERKALQALIQTRGDYGQAYAAVPRRFKVFLLSAYQSSLFNRVLETRLDSLDRVYEGDVAMKHPGRSVFRVEDEAAEQPRASRFEISPTGPVFGYRMMQAAGNQGELERAVLADEGLSLEAFRVGGGIKARGERRSLRFQVQDPELWYDEGLVLKFSLPPGCYATTLLAEIMKT